MRALIIALSPIGAICFLGPLPGGHMPDASVARPGTLGLARSMRILEQIRSERRAALQCCSFRTEINVPQSSKSISVGDSITLLGSCFSENIAVKLRDAKFNVEANPFGISFHPKSIAFCLDRMASGEPFREEDLRKSNAGIWYSFQHHTSFTVRFPSLG